MAKKTKAKKVREALDAIFKAHKSIDPAFNEALADIHSEILGAVIPIVSQRKLATPQVPLPIPLTPPPPRELTQHQKITACVMRLSCLVAGNESWAGKAATVIEQQEPIPSREQLERLYEPLYRGPHGERAWYFEVYCSGIKNPPPANPDKIIKTLGQALLWDREQQMRPVQGSLARPGVPVVGGGLHGN